MRICRDNNPCETWFGADGSFICRHGLVAEASDTTAVEYDRCPADLLYESEKVKWKQFFKDLPRIMERVRDSASRGRRIPSDE